MTEHITEVIELLREIKDAVEDDYNGSDRCPKCKGDGRVGYSAEDYDGLADCPECDGDGIVTEVEDCDDHGRDEALPTLCPHCGELIKTRDDALVHMLSHIGDSNCAWYDD